MLGNLVSLFELLKSSDVNLLTFIPSINKMVKEGINVKREA